MQHLEVMLIGISYLQMLQINSMEFVNLAKNIFILSKIGRTNHPVIYSCIPLPEEFAFH